MPPTRGRGSSPFKVGFGREIISPPRGIYLAGYFGERFCSGLLDDLFVRACLFEGGGAVAGIINYDLLIVSEPLAARVRARLKEAGFAFADDLLLCATHTHLAPSVWPRDVCKHTLDEYVDMVAEKTVYAVGTAYANLRPSELFSGAVVNNPFAFNRRFFMADGSVVTNPGKLNANVVRPEGTVDRGIGILKVVQDAKVVGVIANIVNHTDTIGGDKISADWPGQMARVIREKLDADVAVLTLLGCSGNINHFDITSEDPQCDYAEAKRIGRGYAEIICRRLPGCEPVKAARVATRKVEIEIGFRDVAPSEIEKAERIIETARDASDGGRMTSEELAQGSLEVLKYFARQLIDFVRWSRRDARRLPIRCLELGDELAVVGLPGEPFTEIGMKIKEGSPFGRTFVASLASDGTCGYVPLRECFGRGGYETLPVLGGGAPEDTAERLIDESIRLLKG